MKWIGNKTTLLPELHKRLPNCFGSFFEPFIGSGAFILSETPEKGGINDTNKALINLYIQLRKDANKVINALNQLESVPCTQDTYYDYRNLYNDKLYHNDVHDVMAAALLLYLNHHCFNGLYRVNKKGNFNAAWNHVTKQVTYDAENLKKIGSYLKNNNILIAADDFETFCRRNVKSGDFVYFDSPYYPLSSTANFTRYTAGCFTLTEHKRLKTLVDDLTASNVYCMLSNNDTKYIRDLYENYSIDSVNVPRRICRKNIKEIIITNY